MRLLDARDLRHQTCGRRRHGTRVAISFLVAAGLAVGMAACSGSSDSSTDTASDTTTSAPTKDEATTTTTTATTSTTTGKGGGTATRCAIDYEGLDWSADDKALVAAADAAQQDCNVVFDAYPGAAFGGFALPALIGQELGGGDQQSRAKDLRSLHDLGISALAITVEGKGCETRSGGGTITYLATTDPSKPSPFSDARLRKGTLALDPKAAFAPIPNGLVATLPEAKDDTCAIAVGFSGTTGGIAIAPTNAEATKVLTALVG